MSFSRRFRDSSVCERGPRVREVRVCASLRKNEPYEMVSRNIYHIDLYRINTPSELSVIGLEEYINEPNAIIFIEWPENSYGFLKKFDMKISLKHSAEDERKCKIELNP